MLRTCPFSQTADNKPAADDPQSTPPALSESTVRALALRVRRPLFSALSVDFVPMPREAGLSRAAIAERLAQSKTEPAALHAKGRIRSMNEAAERCGIRIGMPAADALRLTARLRLAAVDPAEEADLAALLAAVARKNLAARGPAFCSQAALFAAESSERDELLLLLRLPEREAQEAALSQLISNLKNDAQKLRLNAEVLPWSLPSKRKGILRPLALRTERACMVLRFLNSTLLERETHDTALARMTYLAESVGGSQACCWTIATTPAADGRADKPAFVARTEGCSQRGTLAADLRRAALRMTAASGGALLDLVVRTDHPSSAETAACSLNPFSKLAASLLERYGPKNVFQLEETDRPQPEAATKRTLPLRFGAPASDHAAGASLLRAPLPEPAGCRAAALAEPSFIYEAPQPLPVRNGLPCRHGPIRLIERADPNLERGKSSSCKRLYWRGEDATGEALWLFRDVLTNAWFLAGRYI